MLSVGLDVHQSSSSICVLDDKGNKIRQREVRGGWDQVVLALGEIKGELQEPLRICYEASTGYGALYERLVPVAREVAVAHPGRLALIFQSKKKSNKADAAKLAALLHLNQVPRVHVPRQEVRSWRGLIAYRGRLVDKRIMAKNQIRALLRGQGIKGPWGQLLWNKTGMKWLAEQKWPTAIEALRLEMLLEEVGDLDRKVQRVTEALDEIAGGHAGVQLLQTIPGVGPRTAEAFVAYVDDPHRFRSGSIGAYFGLVPREDSTGDVRRLGHVTREGPSTVRKLVTEAGWRGVGLSPRMKQVFERIGRGDKSRKKLAIVALGHWLCRVMLAMLKTGAEFRELEEAVVAGVQAAGEAALVEEGELGALE
jgi:transposase